MEDVIKWVEKLNAYPTDMIEELMATNPDEWKEVTLPKIEDRVIVSNLPSGCESFSCFGEVVFVENQRYAIELDDGNEVTLKQDDFRVIRESDLPINGEMWSFSDRLALNWVERDLGVSALSECGFRVYYNQRWGFFFGIDSSGCDFYKYYWCHLYKKYEQMRDEMLATKQMIAFS